MDIRKKLVLTCIPLILLALFISACSSTPGSSGGSNLTVLQVLQNSAKAMQQLKSAHINMSLTGTASTSATPTSTPSTSGVGLSIKGSGDEALPNQESLHITTSQGSNLAEIVLNNKVYIQNPQGQWYVLDKSSLQGVSGNPFSGIDVSNVNNLLALAQHAQITDHGDQTLNGQSLRHITVALDKQGLQQLLTQNSQIASVIGQQNVNTIINSTQNFNSTLDLWIDETHFYVHRTELKLLVNANLGALTNNGTPTATTGNTPSNVSTTLDSIIDLSNFNETVNITAPANAIPTNNPVTIFTGGV